MNRFNNLRIAWRMGTGFAVLLALMAVLIVVGLGAMEAANRDLDAVVNVENVRTQYASEMVDHTREVSIAIRNILLDTSGSNVAAYQATITDNRNHYDADEAALDALVGPGETEELALIARVKIPRDATRQANDAVISLALAGKHDEAVTLMDQTARPSAVQWVNALDAVVSLERQRTLDHYSSAQARYADARTVMVIVAGGALLLALAVGIFLTLGITRPLKESVQAANRIAAGDLTGDVSSTAGRKDELGLLATSIGTMIDNLREQVRGIMEGANALAGSASEILASTTQLAASATESAAAMAETTTTVTEVRQTAELSSQKARVVADTAQKAAQASQGGRKSTEDVIAAMGQIRQQMEAIAASMVRLSEQSQAVGRITSTVDELAAQSNLLAVNAAIEAAKAGEYGKGFGVVAQEVKSLADQSRQATSQVRAVLGDIQKAITAAVMATEQGNKAVAAGESKTGAAAESIQVLAESATEAAQAAAQIAASSQQQLVGMDQVASAMENINQASVQNVAGANQLEAAARNLEELGQRLRQMVARYKVEPGNKP